jgi:hypothetical protein
MELAFERGAAGTAGRFAGAVADAALTCVERPKETSDSGTAGEAEEGAGLWLTPAPSLPVGAMELAFDGGTAGNAGGFAEDAGDAV